ncbi:MAG: RNA 2',3'-cyclic phosphodiesterase [Ignavibacteria bacterium]|nr:RNA 2',3'-cyclic phosphodiesterase [Ignavibacteria bacterium]
MRAFVSINLPEEIKDKLNKIQSEIKTLIRADENRYIRWENRDKFHMTLFFLGDTEEKILNRISEKFERLSEKPNMKEITFTGNMISGFPKENSSRIIFAGLANEDNRADELFREISVILEEEGFKADKRFHPHITLARVKTDRRINLSEIRKKISTDIKFTVKEFYLMESILHPRGSIYKEFRKFSLS